MSRMLLSIKPEYVDKILAGKKKYEFRKFHCRDGIDTIVIYVTAPVKEVIGEVKLLDIIEGDVEYVWHETKRFGGVLKRDYLAYYREREIAIAYQLGEITLYEKPKKFEIWDSITFRSHLHIFN